MTIRRLTPRLSPILAAAALALSSAPVALGAQGVPIHDLIIEDQASP